MQHKSNNTFAETMQRFNRESLRSRYRVTVSYLHFLYNKHADLELLIISHVFLNKDRIYKSFIEGNVSEVIAAPYCDKIMRFLEHRDYPTSFIERKKSSDY